MRTFFTSAFLTLLTSAFAAEIKPLTLEIYLAQVREKHQGYQALNETTQAATLRADEARLLTFPSFFAEFRYLSDQKPTMNPSFQGDKTVFKGYSFGFAEQFPFGLKAKLSYNLDYTSLSGTSNIFVFQPEFFEARPTLELSQSLWQNFFGRQTRATSTLVEAEAAATRHGDAFKQKMTLAEAEMTYWRLVLAREMVEIQKDATEQSRKIYEWNSRRAKMELADRADKLQAAAGLRAKELEHQAAVDELRSSSLEFNSLRGVDSDKVTDALQALDPKTITSLPTPVRKGNRDDVLAAEQMQRLAVAKAEIGAEKNKPTLDVSSTVSLNGRDPSSTDAVTRAPEMGTAVSGSLKTERPTFGIGIKFSTPLDIGTMSDDREAYAREIKAAELNYSRKLFEQEQTWKDLTSKLAEARKRLELALELEDAQKVKLEHERARLKRGRSVTYQVLLFEQDYTTSQGLRIKIETEILGLLARMKTFGDAT